MFKKYKNDSSIIKILFFKQKCDFNKRIKLHIMYKGESYYNA